MKKIHSGVIGCGKFGTFHTNKYLALNCTEFVGVFDINSENMNNLSKKHGVKSYNTLSSLLEAVDVVSITTPASTHYDIARQALESNCHIYVEKPLTMNVEQAKFLVDLAHDKNLILQIGHQERLLFSAIFNSLYQNRPLRSFSSHRVFSHSQRITDASVIFDLMIHDIDFLLHTTKSRIKTITAHGKSGDNTNLDCVNAKIIFEDGMIANLLASRIHPSSLCYVINEYDNETIKINFSEKSISSNSTQDSKFTDIITPYYPQTDIDICNDPLQYNIYLFLQSVQNGTPLMSNYDTICEVIDIAVRIERIAYQDMVESR